MFRVHAVTMICLFVLLLELFETRFLCVVLTILELALWTKLVSNSQRSTYLCLPSARIKGIYHYCLAPKCLMIVEICRLVLQKSLTRVIYWSLTLCLSLNCEILYMYVNTFGVRHICNPSIWEAKAEGQRDQSLALRQKHVIPVVDRVGFRSITSSRAACATEWSSRGHLDIWSQI